MSSPSPDAWNASLYDAAHNFVYRAAGDLVEMLGPKPHERILDLGCGTGRLTVTIANSGAKVVGIDTSPAMVSAAREFAPHLDVQVADARTYRPAEPFDAVFSNATLHWVRPPADAVATVWTSLRPGGRFVAEFGAKGNVQVVREAIDQALRQIAIDPSGLNPWYFPSPGEYASLLEGQGFDVSYVASFPRFTPLDTAAGLRNWVSMFAGNYLAAVPTAKREDFLTAVESIARPTLYRDELWHADYRRLRVVATRPA